MDKGRGNPRVPRIAVIGVGGAGCNVIDHLVSHSIGNVEFIAANTDSHALTRNHCGKKLQLGWAGIGAGAVPKYGRHAAEQSRSELKSALRGRDLVVLVAGLGGGTGTGATPVIARLARKMGIFAIAVLFTPFDFECRATATRRGLERLVNQCAALITVPNDATLAWHGDDASFTDVFEHADRTAETIVRSLSDTVLVPALVNLDFCAVADLFTKARRVPVGVAESTGTARAQEAAEAACASGAVHSVLPAAQRILITITATDALQMSEVRSVVRIVQAHVPPEAFVKYATITDTHLGDRLRVAVFAISNKRHRRKSRRR